MLDSATIRQTVSMLKAGQLSTPELAKDTERQIRDWEPFVEAFVDIDRSAWKVFGEARKIMI